MSNPNIETTKRGYDAFGAGGLEAALDVFDDSAEWMVNGDSMIGGTYRGKAEFAELLSRMAEKSARVEAIRAWLANNEVMAADISSPAAGAGAVVGATAAAFALTSTEPMSDRSVAAEANNSGTAAR